MIFNKIKFNYNIKVLDDLFANKKYTEIWNLLKKQQDEPYFINLLIYILEKFLSNPENSGFYQRNYLVIKF